MAGRRFPGAIKRDVEGLSVEGRTGGFMNFTAGIGVDIKQGDIIGVMGLAALDKHRTQTIQCITDDEPKRFLR